MSRGRPRGSKNINKAYTKQVEVPVDTKTKKNLTPTKAIRAKCIECSCGQHNEIRDCPCTNCPLYNFRLGKNPNKKGKGGFSKDKVLAGAGAMKIMLGASEWKLTEGSTSDDFGMDE